MAGLLGNIVQKVKQGAENIFNKVKSVASTVVQKVGSVISSVVNSGINMVANTVGTAAGVVNRVVVLPVLTIAAKDAALVYTTTKAYIDNLNLDQPKAQTSSLSGISLYIWIALAGEQHY